MSRRQKLRGRVRLLWSAWALHQKRSSTWESLPLWAWKCGVIWNSTSHPSFLHLADATCDSGAAITATVNIGLCLIFLRISSGKFLNVVYFVNVQREMTIPSTLDEANEAAHSKDVTKMLEVRNMNSEFFCRVSA